MCKRWLPVLAAGCLIFGGAGCASGPAPSSASPSSTGAVSTTLPPSTTAAPTVPEKDINPLTGLRDLEKGADSRPVAVMIGNDSRARPQYGIENADMYVEMETEGGITRIMAVFAGASRIPDKLGPVRSARSPFVLLAHSLDAVYFHAGGSAAGKETIQNTGLPHVDALVYQGSTFWRDAALRQSKGLEYSMLTSGSKAAAHLKKANTRGSSSRKAPFVFAQATGSGAGQSVQVSFSGLQSICFHYDTSTGLYTKSNGKLSSASPHKSAGGTALTASNVLVMYDQKYAENKYTIGFRLNGGRGLLVSGGTSRSVTWSRTNTQLSFKEADGSDLKVAPGKTYLCLVADGNAGATIVK